MSKVSNPPLRYIHRQQKKGVWYTYYRRRIDGKYAYEAIVGEEGSEEWSANYERINSHYTDMLARARFSGGRVRRDKSTRSKGDVIFETTKTADLRGSMLSQDEVIKRSVAYRDFPTIYFLIDLNEIIYVGQSVNPIRRMSEQRRIRVFDAVYFLSCLEEDLDELEQLYIDKFKPRDNAPGRYPKGRSKNKQPRRRTHSVKRTGKRKKRPDFSGVSL